MKKIILLPLLILPLLTSCSDNERLSLRYGTMTNVASINDLKELSSQELLTKTRDDKEIFLLAVYHGKYSEGCGCWITFQNVIANYMNKYHEMVYLFNTDNLNEALLNLKIEKVEQSTPYLYVFNGQKAIAKYSYANSRDKSIFEDATGETMYVRLRKKIKSPSLYLINESYLSSLKEDSVVMFMRNGCGDCKYTLNEVLIPYTHQYKFKKDIFLFDMQSYYDLSNKEDATPEEKAVYQNLKDSYGLSEDGEFRFGYQNGVVPTIQYRNKDKILDAAIYFNDSVSKREDGSFYISNSFYSEDRQKVCKYNFPNVLKDMTLTEGVLQTKSGTYYLSQAIANKYHKPNFEAFLKYYVL